jgi:hypothetical protein
MSLTMLPSLQTSIASGVSVSPVLDLGGKALVAIITPAVMSGAKFFFNAGMDSLVLAPLFDTGTTPAEVEVPYAVDAAQHIAMNADLSSYFRGLRYLQLVTVDGAGDPANQGAARTITLVVREE